MTYPKVKDFLMHVVTGTKVVIEDDIIENHVYFEGSVRDYMNSDVALENLTLIQSSIKNNALNVRALKDYEQMLFVELVRELREKTGYGMLDCKKALQATDGAIEKAEEWLKERRGNSIASLVTYRIPK